MKVFDWFVAFLLVNALQGAVQFPIIDDTAPYFDDFPGGESTDAVPLDVSTSDETTSRNTLEPKLSEPVDGSDVLQKSDCSLPPPGCKSTGSTFEEVEFFRITTQKPSKITSPSVETDGTTYSHVHTYIVIGSFFLGTVFVYVAAISITYLVFYLKDRCYGVHIDNEQ
ncbi:uncharacterized protein LOC126471638 [Schistocerca serialis cubense]|uniref:uncharacterized protein LOC126471638 n=1 Tax=Schistocerca serialis cubense TaxID=2023355 RepID=UPI00214E2C4E|nr:uncharacterized protein LOC126471638 [Schistocerca serialis cubense]